MITQGKVLKKSGIYCIENIINKKKYIGSAKNIYHRFHSHKSDLDNKKHQNNYLQNSYNKYGKNSFIFYSLCYCDELKLLQKEEEYIKILDTMNREKGYNLISADRHIWSEETKKRMSIAQTGKKLSEETKSKMSQSRKGMVFTKEAIKNMTIAQQNISKQVKEEKSKRISIAQTGKKLSEETKSKIGLKHYKKIDQLDLYGNYIKTFNSIKDAYSELNIKRIGSIGRVCKNDRPTAYGFKWRYNNEK